VKFTRTRNLADETQYRAEGESFRYIIQRDGKEWHLIIREMETVAGVRIGKQGLPKWETHADTLTLCKSIATEYEALGDEYRSANFSHLERHTVAVQRAYDKDLAETLGTTKEERATMTERNEAATQQDETGAKIEQIQANIERAASLAEADNAEGLAELGKETETLISSLPSRGRYVLPGEDKERTFADIKKTLRGAWRDAAQAKPQPEPKGKAVAVPAQAAEPVDYSVYAGVTELINDGAARVAEGVNLHLKTSDLAKDVAKIMLDIWSRIPNKDGNPDIMGDSHAAKEAARAMYAKAGEGFTQDLDTEEALAKLQRSVQSKRSDVRAQYLRSLDEDADERAKFAKLLESAQGEDVKPSELVAKAYDTSLIGHGELNKARYRVKAGKATPEEIAAVEAADRNGGAKGELPSADERIKTLVAKLKADASKVAVDDFNEASDETKAEVRGELETLYQAVKDMIAATL
jgi:hypothetical protein